MGITIDRYYPKNGYLGDQKPTGNDLRRNIIEFQHRSGGNLKKNPIKTAQQGHYNTWINRNVLGT